ncbi:MAG: inositol monophosphatase family protein [Candidatus Cyclobacteriaceae bacterium M2_1C_046]
MKDLQEINKQLIELTKEVKEYIYQESLNFSRSDIELKGKNDLVSYVDKTAEKKIVEGCSKILPESGFIAEEGTTDKRGDRFNWIIDPLDGTTNFTHGVPVYAISIGLMDNDEIVLGVVYEINRDECFYAIKGQGAFLNGDPIHVSPAGSISESLIATGFPYHNFEKMESYLSILRIFMENSHGLRRMGSAAIDLVYVACGRFEGFFEFNLKPWDIAAGALIVKEAGGVVTDFKGGNNYLFGGDIIAGNKLQAEMRKIITQNW